MTTTKLGKRALRQRGRELRALLNEWDPIGVGPSGPSDEYDCLLWPIMRMLEDGIGQEQLVSSLKNQFTEHFGGRWDPQGAASFAERARAWFRSRRTPVSVRGTP
jgi:hypothetical protein